MVKYAGHRPFLLWMLKLRLLLRVSPLLLAKAIPTCVEFDSKPLINCCLGKIAKGAWELYPSLGSIQELKSKFASVRWEWVPREANAVADAAAAIATRGMGTEVWADRPPSSLVHVLSRDGLPCPP